MFDVCRGWFAVSVMALAVGSSGPPASADEFLYPPGRKLDLEHRSAFRETILERGFNQSEFARRHDALRKVEFLGRGVAVEIAEFVNAKNASSLQRRSAAFALGLVADPYSRHALMRWLEQREYQAEVLAAIAWALGNYPSTDAEVDVKADQVLMRLVERKRRGGQTTPPLVRRMAALSLARRGSTSAVPILMSLVDKGRESEERIRATFLIALGILADDAAIPALERALKSDRGVLERQCALWALGACRGSKVLLEYGSQNPRELEDHRGLLALSLGFARPKDVVPTLSALAEQPPEVAIPAVYAISFCGGDEAYQALSRILTRVESVEERRAAALLAAGTSKDPGRFAAAILSHLGSKSEKVRTAAILSAGFCPSARRPLKKIVANPRRSFRERLDALLSLGRLGLMGTLPQFFEDLKAPAESDLYAKLTDARGVVEGRRDRRVFVEAHEERLVEIRGRFVYHYGNVRNRLLSAALELDYQSIERGGENRGIPHSPSGGSGNSGGGSDSGSSGGSNSGGGQSGGTGGSGGSSADGPPSGDTAGSGRLDGSGRTVVRRNQVRPQRIEHDLEWLLQSGRWFPLGWALGS